MKKAATEALEKAQEGIKAVLKDNPLKNNLKVQYLCSRPQLNNIGHNFFEKFETEKKERMTASELINVKYDLYNSMMTYLVK